jgi:tetratricopeptide (TPR) repeat protein
VAGQLLALASPDRRTLADLIARTIVIPRASLAVEQDSDPEEEAERRSARRARLRNVVLFEVALVALMIGGPVVAARAPALQRASYAAHLAREADERHFEADPTDPRLAQALSADYLAEGDEEKAKKVMARQRLAQQAAATQREAGLRATLAANPKDDDASDGLIDLLEEQGRAVEARAVREAAFRAEPSPEAQAGFGVWLYERDATRDAVQQLQLALDAGLESAEAHAYLGLALRDLGRKPEARAELKRALELDPDLDDVAENLRDLNDELEAAAPPK